MTSEGALFDEQDMAADVQAANRLMAVFGKTTDEMGGVPVSVVYIFIAATLERLRVLGDIDFGGQMQLLGRLSEMISTETLQ